MERLASRYGKTLKSRAIALILILVIPASLFASIELSQSIVPQGSTVNSLASSVDFGALGGNDSEGQKLTFLDSPRYAFTVPGEYEPDDPQHHYWHQYDFGSTVPSNTIMALCVCKLTNIDPWGGSDFEVCTVDPQVYSPPLGWFGGGQDELGYACYSVGADTIWFYGTWFSYLSVVNGKVWCQNAGNVADVSVSVVGYVTQETNSRGFFMDFAQQDYPVATNADPTSWTDINLNTIMPSHSGFNLQGVYIAVDNPSGAQQNVYFRMKGDSGDGITWTVCGNDPGTHLIGWIPVGNDEFQYRTSNGYPISLWVEGFAFDCPATSGDSFTYHVPIEQTMVTESWETGPPYYGAKALSVQNDQSPGQMGQFITRPSAGTNTQIWNQKNSCGGYAILTGLGNNEAFQYWTNPAGDSDGTILVGAMVLQPHS
jgi:hypothetical protein